MKAEIWSHSEWIEETDPAVLTEFFEKILDKSGFNILSYGEHFFEPEGFSACWLLAESHFAVHTWPEEQKTYFEITSCSLEFYMRFLKIWKRDRMETM
ncbi:MAG: S-adenosylmethionine decarboxylase [Planctomycetes bacterium]|nr:S-adenosylmethionine decarboxylase [Planctomycetota bacterium]